MSRKINCDRTTRWGVLAVSGAAGVLALTLTSAIASAAISPVPVPAARHTAGSAATAPKSKWGDPKADKVAKGSDGKNSPSVDPGSLYTVENAIGARAVWAQKDAAGRQITGQGVTVALLDSGTASVPGLTAKDKLTLGPDLSVEGNGPLTDKDTFGHGTFMAGIIGARDSATLTDKTVKTFSPSVQLGVAPDAGLLSMKLANTDGSTDVSQVIAALNWVTEHQTSANGSRVRVVNLSFGTGSIQPYQLDPLAAAAENAWRHGLVVVVSGGNDGQTAGRLTDPAIDPYVLAVGASDSNASTAGWARPTVASFSNSGTAQRHVDLLAPGTSLVSLRAPGSFIDVNHPEGLVSGDTTGRLFRGSGTSQAAAVVSGAAALLLQANANLTPDQVKAVLMATAKPVAAAPRYAGAGQLNISAAVAMVGKPTAKSPLPASVRSLVPQSYRVSTGQGSLDAARGGSGLMDADGVPISGEVDAQGNPWNAATWWAASSTLTSWSAGRWRGAVWTGFGWSADPSGLSAARWTAARWTAARWTDANWSAARWTDASWSAARWTAARWTDTYWG